MSRCTRLVRRLCWLTAALFLPSGAALLALVLTRGELLRLPQTPPHAVEVAGVAVGSVWLLVGAACAVLAAAVNAPGVRAPLRRDPPRAFTV